MPIGPVGSALKERAGVFHVPQGDFDALMIEVAEELSLTLPGVDHWRSLFQTYQQALDKQAQAADTQKGPSQRESAARLRRQLDASRLEAEARLLADSDPDRADHLFREAITVDTRSSEAIANYAEFLASTRRDINGADEMYQRALNLDPVNESILHDYSIFLHHVRHEPDRAEQVFRRLISLDPTEASYLGNYAQLLFAQRRDDEAIRLINKAIEMPTASEALQLEIYFYQYVHLPTQHPRALLGIAEMLIEGVRSEGWSFSPNLERAKEDGDKRLSLLTELANVINASKPLEDLGRFKEWRDAFKEIREI
jgi:Tfp pilus assembly protein PilF